MSPASPSVAGARARRRRRDSLAAIGRQPSDASLVSASHKRAADDENSVMAIYVKRKMKFASLLHLTALRQVVSATTARLLMKHNSCNGCRQSSGGGGDGDGSNGHAAATGAGVGRAAALSSRPAHSLTESRHHGVEARELGPIVGVCTHLLRPSSPSSSTPARRIQYG